MSIWFFFKNSFHLYIEISYLLTHVDHIFLQFCEHLLLNSLKIFIIAVLNIADKPNIQVSWVQFLLVFYSYVQIIFFFGFFMTLDFLFNIGIMSNILQSLYILLPYSEHCEFLFQQKVHSLTDHIDIIAETQPPNSTHFGSCLGFILGFVYRAGGRRRQWHLTPVLLPGKSHGQRSLVGCSPWGC